MKICSDHENLFIACEQCTEMETVGRPVKFAKNKGNHFVVYTAQLESFLLTHMDCDPNKFKIAGAP